MKILAIGDIFGRAGRDATFEMLETFLRIFASEVFSITSSIIEFQLPQPGHFPIHLADSFPHSLHTNTVFAFIIPLPSVHAYLYCT